MWVEELAAQIESETIDGEESSRRLKVWFDEWDIDSGENIISHINKGLKESQFVATILSPEYLSKPFPELEWTHMVARDPTNRSRRLIPILRRSKSLDGNERIDLPAPFLTLKYIDFTDDALYVRKFADLIRRIRGLPPQRGQRRPSLMSRSRTRADSLPTFQPTEDAWEPDQVPDVIIGNLLPVISIPSTICGAPTEFTKRQNVFENTVRPPAFVLRKGQLFTFADLRSSDAPHRSVIDTAKISSEATTDWLLNEDKSKWLQELLNRSLHQHLLKLPLSYDTKERYFFRPSDDDGDRVWTVPGERPRTVAARKTFQADGSTFWVHYGLRAKFRRIGSRFFIELEPNYVFTSDGQNPLGGKAAGKLAIQWTGMQRNVDVLRNVSFWARIIGSGVGRFYIGGSSGILADSTLAVAKLPVGIADDQVRIKSLLEQKVSDLDEAAADLNTAGVDKFVETEQDEEEDESDAAE